MKNNEGHRTGSRFFEMILLIVFPILCHYLIPVKTLLSKPYTYMGVVIMAAGLFLAIRRAAEFRNAGISYRLHGGSSMLVTSGTFRFSRNPIYLGMLFWLVGMAVLLGSLTPFVFPVLFFVTANFIMIPFEERNLERLFGLQYNEYKQITRRWL